MVLQISKYPISSHNPSTALALLVRGRFSKDDLSIRGSKRQLKSPPHYCLFTFYLFNFETMLAVKASLNTLVMHKAEQSIRPVRQRLYELGNKPNKYLARLFNKKSDSHCILLYSLI